MEDKPVTGGGEGENEAAPKVVTLSFLDSESKLILNRIHDKLESLDQKMGFVTEFLLHKISGGVPSSKDLEAGEPRRKLIRLEVGRETPDSVASPQDKSGSESSATSAPPAPLPQHSYEEPEEDPGPPPVPGHLDITSPAMRHFPEEALRRAADKASKSFSATQPKVFAWQMFRETHSDVESAQVKIPLRASHGEHAEHFLARQTPKVRGIVYATLEYFGWSAAPEDFRLAKAKLICSHIKNNAKVRNWTLREGMRNGAGAAAGAGSGAGRSGSGGVQMYPAALMAQQSAALLTEAQRNAALQLLSTAAGHHPSPTLAASLPTNWPTIKPD